MRPKTTDKAGKGAAAGPTSVGEPSEPTPDSPFCLTLVLDVCLVAAETLGQPTAIAIDAAGPQPDSLPDDIQEAPLLVNPFFRYTFVNGDRITTPTVGLAGSSWTAVVTPSAGSNVESIPTTDGSWAAAEVGEVVENETLPECVVWRYRRTHQLQGADDGEVALNLDRNPFMQVTLADVSTLGATAQPPGPGMRGGTGYAAGTDGAAHSVKATSIPGRNFIESWPLDLSAFLAGNTSVDLFLGQCCDGVQSGGNRNRVDPRQSASFQQQDGKTGIQADAENATMAADDRCLHRRADGHPAPPGIRHMHISVCVSRPDIQIPGNMPETEQKGESNAGDITMAAREKGPDTAAKLFSKETLERLNPLSITITSESSLPGVRIEASSLQQHVQQNRFALLEKYCKPIYVVCRPFPDDPVSNTLHPRVLWTAFSSQKSRARFAHTSAFLLGRMDRHRLEEWAETFSLSVEVHDRDPALSEVESRARILRLEKMVACGCPVEAGDPDSPAGRTAADGKVSEHVDSGEAKATAPTARYAEPRDIYEVDALALREAIASAASAGNDCAHGVASFRLSGLLDQSRQLHSAYDSANRNHPSSPPPTPAKETRRTAVGEAAAIDIAPRLKMRSNICQRKRRKIPKGGVEDWHLSDGERFVRRPGSYLDAGSSLGIRLSLARPLRTLQEGSAERTGPATEALRPFKRAVFVVEYEGGGQLVHEVAAAMDEINGRALKSIQGSLRSYRLTAEEREAANNGSLDIICGFMVIDEDSRTIVLEGMAGPQGGLTELLAKVGRAGPNGQAYRALENPEVRFSGRLYTCFDADLKKVRLRVPLPILCRNPEIYDRSKVSADCFDALHSLRMLRQVDRLREAAEHGLFPGAAQVIQVESKYGESISVKDITGREPVKKNRGKALLNPANEPGCTQTDGHGQGIETGGRNQNNDVRRETLEKGLPPASRKAPTDARNETFEEWLRGRKPRNFLAEQEEMSDKMSEEYAQRRRRRQEELQQETVRTDWCYGPQKLNYVELKKAEMRERLSRDKRATYTYSADYVSQTVSMVDAFRGKEDQEAKNRAMWKTRRGFVWPCPRTRQELITHPRKPSDSRIDTLRESWVENELTGGRGDQDLAAADKGIPRALAWRPKFDAVPCNGTTLFGGLQLPRYDRELDTSLIGSQVRLPRGRQHLEKDPEYFRSVHLVGEGLAKEKEEVKRKAEEFWRSKVVVDDTDFRVGNFSVRDVPLQVDRAKDILQFPVKKIAFKIVRNAKLPSGKRTTLRSAPVSAFSSEPFSEPEDFTGSIRANHRERWAASDPLSGEKLDFYLRLHSDRMKPNSQKVCSRLKHPSMLESDVRGPRWETGREREGRMG